MLHHFKFKTMATWLGKAALIRTASCPCQPATGESQSISGMVTQLNLNARVVSPNREWDDDYLVYVLNAGGEGHLAGFHLDSHTCELEYIHDSVWTLQPDLVDAGDLPNVFASPSQVSFSPHNEHLVVNIKRPLDGQDNVQGHFVLYKVLETGCLEHLAASESNGNTPWAFIFSPHQKLISTEFNGPGDDISYVSSYMLGGEEEDCEEEGQLILDKTIPLENEDYHTFMAGNIAYVSELVG